MKKTENSAAFPSDAWNNEGMTLLDYFIAHAPPTPLWDYKVPMDTQMPESIYDAHAGKDNSDEINEWLEKREVKKRKIWASEWAKEQLK